MQKINNLNKIIKKLIVTIIFSTTFLNISFAASGPNPFEKVVSGLTDFFGNAVSTLLFSVATVAFFISVIRFLINRSAGKGGDAWADAKERLLWSAGALFVMFSIWGIVNFLQISLLGDYKKNSISAPTIERAGSTNNSDTNSNSGCASSACSSIPSRPAPSPISGGVDN